MNLRLNKKTTLTRLPKGILSYAIASRTSKPNAQALDRSHHEIADSEQSRSKIEVSGLLVDEQLLELEGHLPLQKKRVESRAVDRVEEVKVERFTTSQTLETLWVLKSTAVTSVANALATNS